MADMLVKREDGTEFIKAEIAGVWEHSCGSQFFYLNDDGTVNCASCDHIVPTLSWTRQREQ